LTLCFKGQLKIVSFLPANSVKFPGNRPSNGPSWSLSEFKTLRCVMDTEGNASTILLLRAPWS